MYQGGDERSKRLWQGSIPWVPAFTYCWRLRIAWNPWNDVALRVATIPTIRC